MANGARQAREEGVAAAAATGAVIIIIVVVVEASGSGAATNVLSESDSVNSASLNMQRTKLLAKTKMPLGIADSTD